MPDLINHSKVHVLHCIGQNWMESALLTRMTVSFITNGKILRERLGCYF